MSIRGYDAWLERPYQEMCAAQEAEEDLDDRANDAAWEVILDKQQLISVVGDMIADGNEPFQMALTAALSKIAERRCYPGRDPEGHLDDEAVGLLHAALNMLEPFLKARERERLIEEDRKANETAADDLAAELHEARCLSLGIDP